MFFFKKMVERLHDNHPIKLLMKPHQEKILKEIIHDNEVFVFSPSEKDQRHIDVSEEEVKIDAPFKVFSIELAGKSLTSMPAGEGNEDVRIEVILVHEISPCVYDFYDLVSANHPHGGKIYNINYCDSNQGEHYRWHLNIMDEMLKILSSQKVGVENVNSKFKVGTGKNKYFHKIKKVIHVTPKKLMSEAKSSNGKVIDWTHRFSVRGHWRDHDGIGKDRDDNYCVEGKTWVKSHVRGPEDKPLIKKQRVVL